MVKSNWIKTASWSDFYPSIDYIHKKSRFNFVSAFKTGLPAKEMKRRGKAGTYILRYRKSLKTKPTSKYFKTKRELLKALDEYLRKN